MQHENRSIRVTTADSTHTDSILTLGLVAPAASAEHFTVLARERLERFTLPAPVHTIRLVADTLVPLAGGNLTLFEDNFARNEDWAKLVERLRARLGTQAVHSLAIAAEHRPEYAVQRIEPATKPATKPAMTSIASTSLGPRPLWLLTQPRALLERNAQPYDDGPLSLLAGPERIESGWWDGHDVTRDYFIAARADRSLVWVYRERGSATGRWYLHGLFA